MKKLYLLIGCGLVSLSMQAFAAEASMGDGLMSQRPCLQVFEACKSSGQFKNEDEIKGCVKSIIMGQSVNGVEVGPNAKTVVEQCKAKMKQRWKNTHNM